MTTQIQIKRNPNQRAPKRCQISQPSHPLIHFRKKEWWNCCWCIYRVDSCQQNIHHQQCWWITSFSTLSLITPSWWYNVRTYLITTLTAQFCLFLFPAFPSPYLYISFGNPILFFLRLMTRKHKWKSAPHLFLCRRTHFLCCFDTLNDCKHTFMNIHTAFMHKHARKKRKTPWR